MPRNNGAAAKERRRLEAAARSGQQVAVKEHEVLSAEELATRNSAAAAAKASHPEGLGHPDPELSEVGLQEARHVSRWIRDKRGRLVLRTDGKACGIGVMNGCLSCIAEAEDAETAELNHKIFAANAGLRIVRDAETKRAGLPPRKHGPHERPDVGFALQDRA
jgi:hypothetical protein